MFNKAIIIGRLTGDPELKKTPNDVSVSSFTVAVDRPYRKDGEKKADFLNVVAWRQTADFVTKYFSKGNAIGVEGSIQTRSYTDKENNKRYVVEVVADNVFFVESKSNSDKKANAETPKAATPDAEDFQTVEDDEDLPF